MDPVSEKLGPIDPQAEGGNFSMWLRMVFVALALAAVLAVNFEWPVPVRAILVLLFLCTVPGAAAMSFAPRLEPLAAAALTLATSMALSTTVALVAILMRAYEPDLMLYFTAAVSIILLFWGPRASEVTHIADKGRHYKDEVTDKQETVS